jgi:hypothetical protein
MACKMPAVKAVCLCPSHPMSQNGAANDELSMKKRIYISHSAKETEYARRLAMVLSKGGFSTILSDDLDQTVLVRSRRVRPVIGASTAVVVLISHLHSGSKDSNTDVLIAAGTDKPCLALLVDMDHVHAARQAAPLLRRLRYAVRVKADFAHATSALRSVLHHFAQQPPAKQIKSIGSVRR